MNLDKKDVIEESSRVEFVGADEYDIVSSNDLVLLSQQSLPSNYDPNENLGDSSYNKQFSSIKEYEEEWNELYSNNELDLEKLKQKCVKGQLRSSHFRSICWRCLLSILHKEPKQWPYQLKTYRNHYNEVCLELEHNPWEAKGNNPYDNPLSQESESVWQKYFCDEELKAVIQQDVTRTFPDLDFFRQEGIQHIMVRILFCYARQNPSLCYRQGMHEILAPLIFILHCDHQALLHAKEKNPSIHSVMFEILNPENLEQDAYSMFKYIMDHIECSYRINNVLTTSSGQFLTEAQKFENKYHENEVLRRLDYIRKNILQKTDPDLNKHLEKLDIPLHLFGIRWLRLLFGREFVLQDLLVLWDFIFANNFETVDYIVVAMLVAIRGILLVGDYTACLSSLMRYPTGIDVTYIVLSALHIKDPSKNPAPDITQLSLPQAKAPKNTDNPEISSQNSTRLKRGPSRPPQWFLGKTNQFLLGPSGDGEGIAHGYVVNDPNLLIAQLEQTNMFINAVRHKLTQYHSILSANLQNNSNAEIQLALDGILELTCVLKSHSKEANYEVETACEAGEIKEPRSRKIPNSSANAERVPSPSTSINSDRKSHTKTKKCPKSGELTVFKYQKGSTIDTTLMTDPLYLIKNLKEGEY